jgi:hypothetical protein
MGAEPGSPMMAGLVACTQQRPMNAHSWLKTLLYGESFGVSPRFES